jgi:hypothetical protein
MPPDGIRESPESYAVKTPNARDAQPALLVAPQPLLRQKKNPGERTGA